MKILFHNAPCGSGIEQVGYVFLLLLKKLGHDIDLWNIQCANTESNVISKTTDDYDAVILNEAFPESFARIIQKESDRVWNISHGGDKLPSFCKQLSLNYLNHRRFFDERRSENVTIPLTYPYSFRKEEFNSVRPLKFMFVGRWTPDKFNVQVKRFMEENNIRIDLACFSEVHPQYDFRSVVDRHVEGVDMNEIYRNLRSTKFLLLPSTTECISLVVGEALTNGCIPIVLDTKEGEEHDQFMNCATAYSSGEFNEAMTVLGSRDISDIDRRKVFDLSNRMFSIDRSLAELKALFGTGRGGNIRIMSNGRNNISSFIPYINATIITGEKIY